MQVEVLASVMNEEAEALCKRMNLSTDAVVINQCGEDGEQELFYNGHRIRFYSYAERGVGKSRNHAIDHAQGNILLFSDADIVYENGYGEAIAAEFEKMPQADMLLFQIGVAKERATYENTGYKKVGLLNCGRYGAVSFAIKREALIKSGERFSLLFGGGAKYSNGEDSLFLQHLIQKGLQVYTSPVCIGREDAGKSSWFTGYHEKFFHDRGVLYHFLYGKLAKPLSLRFLLAHKALFCKDVSVMKAYGYMKDGIREGKSIPFE
ncbi:MAG: glycosyltransferase family 2 protein [Lachnospiraceae bacterium]|nr:glycosyltransferase family 2 protein [Lachnospiraceae bacterium]